MAFESILNPILGPLLQLPPFWAVFIISFIIALIITLVYKWMTDQHLMKTLKEEIKTFQQQMKEFKDDPKRVMEIQKRAMQTNMKYMMHSMRPTLVTFLPIILIFGWLNANLSYQPIAPGQEFSTKIFFQPNVSGDVKLIVPESIKLLTNSTQQIKEGKAEWRLKGEAGEYILEYQYKDRIYSKELLITSKQAYKGPVKKVNDDTVIALQTDHEKTVPLQIFGWKIGWLGTYILFSVIFSMTLRKIFKIH